MTGVCRLLRRTGVVSALVAGLWVTLLAPGAQAHALLIAATPGADSTVASSPGAILLTFSEPVDPRLSSVQVFDAHGRPQPGVSASRPVAGNPQQLRIALANPLPHGVYTIEWRTVSALDGHFAGGTYAFGVGVSNIAAVAPFGKYVSTAAWLTTAATVGRWLLYAGLAVLIGAAGTCGLVLGGRLPRGGASLLGIGWLLAAVGVSTVILTERAITRAPSLLPLFETHEGLLLLGQGAAVFFFCGVGAVAVGFVPRRETFAILGLMTAIAVFTLIWLSHANSPSPWRLLNLADLWVHVAAVGVWIGGLPWLLLGLRTVDGSARVAAVRRFSLLASVALGLVVLTGILRAAAEVGSLTGILHSSFGHAFVVKMALFCVLVALGALNHFVLVPHLRPDGEGLVPLRRSVRGEVVLGVAVLAATGVLSGLAPASVSIAAARATASSQRVLIGSDYAQTVRVRLVVSPGTVGRNEFTATISDYWTGKQVTGARAVELDFSLPARPSVQPSTLALAQGPGGLWRGGGFELSVEGTWTIEVVIQEATTAVTVPLTLEVNAPA